jgi:hypothetical protein
MARDERWGISYPRTKHFVPNSEPFGGKKNALMNRTFSEYDEFTKSRVFGYSSP